MVKHKQADVSASPSSNENKSNSSQKECSQFCVLKDNLGTVIIGICLRLFVFRYLSSEIQYRSEWTSPLASVERLRDGIAMRRDGLDPYSGDSFHVLPIYLVIFDRIVNVDNEWMMLIFHIFIDSITGLVLSYSAWTYCGQNEMRDGKLIAMRTAKIYLFNPLTIGSCAILNLTTLHNCILSLVVLTFTKGCVISCSVLVSLSAVSSLYPLTLLASLWIRFKEQRTVMFTVVFSGILLSLFLNFLAAGSKWDFIEDTYLFILRVEDLSPNCGVFWYFFTQVFEHFRDFYLAVFQANAFIYVLPLTLPVRYDSHLHLCISLLLLSVFSAYPSLADSAVYISILPLMEKYNKYLRYSLIICCTMLSCVLLMPIMWNMWIVSSSGNANFYFAVTLIYNVAQVYLLMDLIYAYFRKEGTKHYGQVVNDETKFVLY